MLQRDWSRATLLQSPDIPRRSPTNLSGAERADVGPGLGQQLGT
jgi:hypothetical protein